MENMVKTNKLEKSFWKGKKVLVTGHTGFKGSWLTIWLNQIGAKVYGISLAPDQKPSLFEKAGISRYCKSIICDIRDYENTNHYIKEINPEIIFHLAAQPLVKESYENPLNTFSTNIMGSINILNISRNIKNLKTLIVITTDKVYKNKEWDFPYRENDELGGSDPYSASKASLEIIINSFRESFFKDKKVNIFSARAGNVIGGGDWSKDRLIPDTIKAWKSSSFLNIRRPDFIRPWQHVLEPLFGYMLIAQHSNKECFLKKAYNFGPNTSELITVRELVEISKKYIQDLKVKFNYEDTFHESGKLLLENSLAKKDLGYCPRWDLEKTIKRTIEWYKGFYEGNDAFDLCLKDIYFFER
nr:CDP-glucose 4,6-dehydratase [Prochlorococcus marinus]